MSLQHAAQYLAAQGRGPDTMLVHMSRDEVSDLQKAARAYGGSLSINPETGLPEAGFFDEVKKVGKAILPAAAGAVLGPLGFGLSPLTAGLTAGAIRGVTSGSLEKGLMFGLGAYGGAGLSAGLANLGTGAISQAAGAGLGEEAAQQAVADQLAQSSLTDKLSAGARYAFDNPMNALKGLGGGSAIKGIGTLGAALSPAMLGSPQTTTSMPTASSPQRQYYSYDPGRVKDPEAGYTGAASGERRYFEPTFKRLASGGTTSDDRFSGNRYVFAPAQTITSNPASGLSALQNPFESQEEYEYIYDPVAQKFIRAVKPKKETPKTENSTTSSRNNSGDSGIDGGSIGGTSGSVNPADTIAIGQALQSYGDMFGGLAPGGWAASALGGAIANSGISALGAMESAAAKAEAEGIAAAQAQAAAIAAEMAAMYGDEAIGAADAAAANAAANQAGISAAFGNADSTYGGPSTSTSDASTSTGDASSSASDHGAGIDASGMYNMGGITALARGGYSHLGDYSDGGRLLRGPGDGVSDSIPATIANKRPARLADGEFVVPARIVSELGNGSTEAGARKLYAMMDRVQRARGKTTGKGKVAKNTRADKYLPA